MKKLLILLSVATLMMGSGGCKKDKSTDAPYIGLWEVTEYKYTERYELKYIRFNHDKTLSLYADNSLGFKDYKNTAITADDDLIVAYILGLYEGDMSPSVYKYSINGNELILYDNSGVYLKAIRSISSLPDNWVSYATPAVLLPNMPRNLQGISFDGTNLLFADYDNGIIKKINPQTGALVTEITTMSYPNTVEFDGTGYWISRNGYDKLHKVDLGGMVVFSSVALDGWMYGIGYVNESTIITYANSNNTLYRYNPQTNTISNSLDIGDIDLSDMAVWNGKVYALRHYSNIIYRINPSDFSVEKVFCLGNTGITNGIAADGNGGFWVTTKGGRELMKVNLD